MRDRQRARFTRWLNTTTLPVPYQLRVKALDWLVGTQLVRAVMYGTNMQMDFDVADALQVNMYLDGYWDRKLSNWLAFFAARSDTLADIGAHVGYFTLLMGHYSGPDAAVHAFEPNPVSFQGLVRNIAINNLNATANPLAVTQAKGALQMHLPHRFLSGAARIGPMAHTRQTVNVNAISLDEYCQQNGLSGFDLIKMDIEGAEVQAILGMASGLRRGDYGVLFISNA